MPNFTFCFETLDRAVFGYIHHLKFKATLLFWINSVCVVTNIYIFVKYSTRICSNLLIENQ